MMKRYKVESPVTYRNQQLKVGDVVMLSDEQVPHLVESGYLVEVDDKTALTRKLNKEPAPPAEETEAKAK